jgi:DNA-binding NtrC family response regulator
MQEVSVASLSRVPHPQPRIILCVDDEADGLFLRKTLLEEAGYSVLTATNAADAVKIFGSNKIDLVVSDHLLRGLTGAEMASRMKLTKPNLPILLLSGVGDLPEGTQNIDRFLNKAEGPEKLLQTVAELLRYRRFQLKNGPYSADIACDTRDSATTWHYVVQEEGSSEILSWRQARSEKAAVAAAQKELRVLNRGKRDHVRHHS